MLDLRRLDVTKTIEGIVGQYGNISELNLDYCPGVCDGTISSLLKLKKSLKKLSLRGTNVTNDGCYLISQMEKLEYLTLSKVRQRPFLFSL